MIERAVQVHLASFLTKNAVLSEHQSGLHLRTHGQTDNDRGCLKEGMPPRKLPVPPKQIEHYGVRGLGHDLFKKYLQGITHTQGVKYECNLSSSPIL
ncbi:unnamed protein product, partial [Pocillopora meandrina]